MKHAFVVQEQSSSFGARASSAGHSVLRLLPIVALVSACGGNSADSGGLSNALPPLLKLGMQRQYVGTATRSVVYVNPTVTTPDNTLAYSFTQIQSVNPPPASTSASFDVHSSYTYNVTQDPGVGTVPISQVVDNYENLLVSGTQQTMSTLGQTVVAVSSDETSNALGTGPYTQTTSTTTTYPTARDTLPYPLQAGARQTVPQSASQTITFSDVNGSGSGPSDGSNVAYTMTRNENFDGSFSYQATEVNGNSFTRTQNSDGSGGETFSSATSTTTTTVGLPAIAGGVNTIPVTVTVTGATTTTTNHAAADWYPNNGTASSPLVSTTRVVVGPVASLPPECSGALSRPGLYEVDTTTTNLNTLSATYALTTTRSFNSGDAVPVCQLSTEIQSDYALQTGALVSTITTNTTTLLSAINY